MSRKRDIANNEVLRKLYSHASGLGRVKVV
jgi:hypothetical protein